MILNGKLRFHQLVGIDKAEIVIPFSNDEIDLLWTQNEHWQRECSNFLVEITNEYPQSRRL